MGSHQSVEMPGDNTVEEPAVGLQDVAQEAAALRLAEVHGQEKAQRYGQNFYDCCPSIFYEALEILALIWPIDCEATLPPVW